MAEEEQAPKKSGGLMGLVKAVVIVAVLVVVEMVAAAMMIPSAEETEALARDLARVARGEEAIELKEEEERLAGFDEPTVEVELFTNNITRFNPETDATLNVQFSVHGVLLAADQEEFQPLYDANMNRIHEQIMLTIHGADVADLASAGLGLIKRQILEKTNRTLGRPLLREVVFTQLNFLER